ncbi:hypothetical protein DBR37_08615 [Herminiimonas sp. KBW02]|nr:hypothetical protein DBR37_08615 [Herminiimonas sp. KBW02]
MVGKCRRRSAWRKTVGTCLKMFPYGIVAPAHDRLMTRNHLLTSAPGIEIHANLRAGGDKIGGRQQTIFIYRTITILNSEEGDIRFAF